MTQDDIIRMAREAGWTGPEENVDYTNMLKRFAALVAAAEREKVARWQIGSGYSTGHGETIEDLLVELEWQVRESEREACAKVCEQWEWANNAADAIRARRQTGQQRVNEALNELQADGTLSPAEHRRLVNRPWSSP